MHAKVHMELADAMVSRAEEQTNVNTVRVQSLKERADLAAITFCLAVRLSSS